MGEALMIIGIFLIASGSVGFVLSWIDRGPGSGSGGAF